MCGSSGNGDGARIFDTNGRETVALWCEAPEGPIAARFRFGDADQTVPVADGFVLAVFDDAGSESPSLEAWL